MGITIGDALSVIAFIGAVYVSMWASIVGFALIFPKKAASARVQIESAPWVNLILGAAVLVIAIVVYGILMSPHNPLTTLLAIMLALWVLALMVVGGSGLALVMGAKMQQMDRRCSQFRGMARSAGLMILAAILPIFGWAVGALAMIASLGAGFQAVVLRRGIESPAVRQVPPPASGGGQGVGPEFDV